MKMTAGSAISNSRGGRGRRPGAAASQEKAVAAELARVRIAAGMTQRDVAEAMGVSQPAVARMESGGNVSVRTIIRYATAVGRPVKLWICPGE